MDGGGVATVVERQSKAAGLLRQQSRDCGVGGSPLYAALLDRAAADVEGGGVVWSVLRELVDDPTPTLALRFLRAVHRLVLEGRAPRLGGHFPSVGGTPGPDVWEAFLATLEEHRDAIIALTRPGCQTNEVGRAGPLLPAFLLLARQGLPFRLLECASSAGLLLWWDRFRYEQEAWAWGDPSSPVLLRDPFEPPAPAIDGDVDVAERRGCDPNPVDPTDDAQRLDLMASVWADQTERLEALEGAIRIAADEPRLIDRAGAIEWLSEQLTQPRPGVLTVVYHTVMLFYLSHEDRARLPELMADFGARATEESPLAWLRLEAYAWPEPMPHQVWLQTWPGGEDRMLARSGPHGRPVRWVA